MPTYQYQCRECGRSFELFHSMTAQPARRCPSCGGKVKKLIGAGSGIIVRSKSAPPASSCSAGERSCSCPAGRFPYCGAGG